MTQKTLPELKIAPTVSELNNRLCEKIAQEAEECCKRSGQFTLVLSGGNTPKAFYETLSGETWRSRIPWLSLRLFLGDERCVEDTSPESNFRMIHETLISRVPINPEHILRPVGQAENPELAAQNYERLIREQTNTSAGEFPVFDLVLLGLGDDGHTASLFPGSPALEERQRVCVANPVEKLGTTRLTLTYPAINAARNICFLVTGEKKADIVARVLESLEAGYPAQSVHPSCPEGLLEWYLDISAASQLTKSLDNE